MEGNMFRWRRLRSEGLREWMLVGVVIGNEDPN